MSSFKIATFARILYIINVIKLQTTGNTVHRETEASPFVEGHVWRALAITHDIASPSIAQKVIDLLLPIGEQEC